MNKVRNFCIGAGIIVLCMAVFLTITVLTKKPQPAIDFTATLSDGSSFTLSDNYGKCGTVLIFIDPETEGSIDVLREVTADKKDADIIAVSVSSLSKNEQLKLIGDSNSFDKLCFEGADIVKLYNIGNAPITYFIDKNGLVQNGFVGNIKKETIQKYISKITETE